MDSPASNANQQALSNVSSKSPEPKRSPSVDSSQSSEATIPAENPQLKDVENVDDEIQMAIPDRDDREYGCKFCHKKFTNKQALGGHQNAHKIERAMEKNALNLPETSLAYFGGTSPPSTTFLSSYHRSHGFMSRSFLSLPYPTSQPGISVGYSCRPGPPGFDNVYSCWSPPLPRMPEFTGQPSYMPNPDLNPRFSGFMRPVSPDQGQSCYPGSRIRPDRINPGGGNNNVMNVPGNEEVDESGLDLSLKL